MSEAVGSETNSSPARAPLEGVLVADFSRILSGPLATMFLGDLGATVVKVERPFVGDDTRHWGPPFVDGESAYYLAANRNKRSIALDLSTDDGRQTAWSLIQRADVVVENFVPGTMEKFGLDYDSVIRVRPEIIYCSISGFGERAGRNLPGYDFIVQAAGGLMSITGPGADEPYKTGVALVDVLTGLHATVGILAALRVREQSGVGQRIELNLLSSLLASLVNQASSFLVADEVPTAMGNRHPQIVPYETLRTRDSLIAIAAGNDPLFRALCSALGRGDLAEDTRFRNNPSRVQNRSALVYELEAALCSGSTEEWVTRLREAGVPASTVNDIPSAFALAEALGLDPVVVIPTGRSGGAQVANPIRFSATPVTYGSGPPGLGEHTKEIRQWLRQSQIRTEPT